MNPPVTVVKDQRKVDSDQLSLLAIFHYVGAALSLVGIGFLALHYSIMHSVFTNPQAWQGQKASPPPAEMFAMFKWIYLVLGVVFLGYGILNVISALSIQARKRRIFSMVVAGLNCIHVPLGTLLGVFTFVVLGRYSVQQLYAEKSAASPPTGS